MCSGLLTAVFVWLASGWYRRRVRAEVEAVWEARFRIWAANDLSYRLSRDRKAAGYAVTVEEASQEGAYYVRPSSPGLGDPSAPPQRVPWTGLWGAIHDRVQP